MTWVFDGLVASSDISDDDFVKWGNFVASIYRKSQRKGPHVRWVSLQRPQFCEYRNTLDDFLETPAEQVLCNVESLQLDMKVAKFSFSSTFQVKTFLEKDLPLSLKTLGLISKGIGGEID